MTDTRIPELVRIAGYFGEVLDLVAQWSEPLSALFCGEGQRPTRRMVDEVVEPLAARLLDRTDLRLVGAGFVAAHHALADVPWHMAWWQGAGRERLMPSAVEEMGEVYARREWFTVPMETGAPHVAGPYVDFLCTDEYTLTLTVPVPGRNPAGVAGADVFVESLENLVGPDLAALHPRATLVNRGGRVVVSADPQLAAGTLLVPGWQEAAGLVPARGGEQAGTVFAVEPCPGLPLAVVRPPEGS